MVIKRDGRKVPYDPSKIQKALEQSFLSVDKELTDDSRALIERIVSSVTASKADTECNVEELQDILEKKLMSSSRKDVARAYITYRNDRTRIREHKTVLIKNVKEKLSASNVQNQNANVDERSFGGRKGEADSELMRKIALDDCVSKMARRNHENNEIYIHDLDSYAVGMHNCLSIPFDKLLASGFNTRQTDVRPARSVNTAMQLVAVIFQLQSLQQFGGVAATHLDWTMVPYVRLSFWKHFKDGLKYVSQTSGGWIEESLPEDKTTASIEDEIYKSDRQAYEYAMDMTTKEIYQAVEGLYHNLNTLQSRSGNQLPFTSINYGTCTLPEGRLIIKALLDTSIKGIGKFHRTSIFPCGIMVLKTGINRKPGDPNYDLYQLALKSTAKRLYPNYANGDVVMQKDWIAYDRDCKTKIINSLTDEERNILIDRILENPQIGEKLMLEVIS